MKVRLWSMKLKRSHRYRCFWTCSACGTPRRIGIFHAVKKCGKCKSTDPNYIVIQEKRRPWDKESLGRSVKSNALVAIAKESFDKTGVGGSLANVVKGARPRRKFGKRTRQWFVQIHLGEDKFVGFTDSEPCFLATPQEVIKYMKETKMMQLRMPRDLHRWFKKYTQEHDTTMTTVVILYLERLRAKSKKNFEVKQI